MIRPLAEKRRGGRGRRVMSVIFVCEWIVSADMKDQDFETVNYKKYVFGVQRLVVACIDAVDVD